MSFYIFNISLIAVAGSIICILCPEVYAKYVSFAASLAVMLVIISPLKDIKAFSITIPEQNEEYECVDLKESAASALARSVFETIEGKYGNADVVDNITVSTADYDTFEVEKITVTINPETQNIDTETLETYISNLYGVKTVVNEKQSSQS